MQILLLIIFPVFGIMALGAIAERFHLLGPRTATALNQYVYYFALPALLFTSTASAKVESILNWNFMIAYSLGTILTFILFFVFAKWILREKFAVTTLQALSATFPNTGYVGIPILFLLLGPESVVPATVVTLLQFCFMVVAIVMINISLEKEPITAKSLVKLVTSTVGKNPIAISGFLGIAWSFTGWYLPKPIYQLGHQLGITAGTCALFAIGKIMMSLRPKIKFKEQSLICFFKLVAQPLLIFPFFYYFQVSDFWAASGIVLAALPPAVLIYIFAQNYQLHEKSFAGILLASNLLSILTLSILLTLLPVIWPKLKILASS